MRFFLTLLALSLAVGAWAQANTGAGSQGQGSGISANGTTLKNPPAPPAATPEDPKARKEALKEQILRQAAIAKAEKEGISVRIKGLAHFRGIRSNQLMGTGLVVGLAGTGDTRKSAITQQLISNMFKDMGVHIDPNQIDMRNVAAVIITANLPPFATNGQAIDVEVQSIGDAKSLLGGTLLQTPLYAAGDQSTIYAAAQGPVNVGGFDVSAGGSSQKKNHVTAGRVPEGALVERGAPTKLVFDGKMYLDLNQPDLTTAERTAQKINEMFPQMNAIASNGGTIELSLPDSMTPVQAMSKVEELSVMADTQETIVINEKTGTIVIGGNVRLGPAAIVHGSLNVQIDQQLQVSQPEARSGGQTVVVPQNTITVDNPTAQIASIAPNTTVADLARIFQALQLKSADVMAILQALREQGALKARIISQ